MVSNRILLCFVLSSMLALSTACNSKTPVVVEVHDSDKQVAPLSPPHPSVPSLNGEYNMDVVCDTNPELHLQKITITDMKTIADLTFTSERFGDTGATPWMNTAAPGKQMAFYIADPDTRAEYKLLNVEGIALEPARTTLQEGQSVSFRLTFERIPDHFTKFHLIEGKSEIHDTDGRVLRSWTFMNVPLK